MAIEDKETLKTYFTTGKSPTQSDFENLIDSFINQEDADITVDSQRNIGIGIDTPVEKLEVDGAIRVGDTTNANIEAGTIRWDPTANNSQGDLQGYDGTRWRSLISGGGWEDEGSYSYTENSITIGDSEEPKATLDIDGTLRLKDDAALTGSPGTLRWDGSDLKLKMTDGNGEVDWTSLTETNVFTKIKVYENENMGIGLEDNDTPQARVHIKGPVMVEGPLEVTERLYYKGNINEEEDDASTPSVLEGTANTIFGDIVSYNFTRPTRVFIEASLPFLNGSCRAKIALCHRMGDSEVIVDEVVVKVSDSTLGTTIYQAVKLSGYANIPQNTTVEFYVKVTEKETGTVRLNNDNYREFNCFGTIQLIEI